MDPLYHEQLPAGLAQQILQDDFIPGDNMSYYMVSELYNTVIVQCDNNTGKATETTLSVTELQTKEEIPRIESYSGEYETSGTGKYVIIQLLFIGIMLLITVLGIYALYNISR